MSRTATPTSTRWELWSSYAFLATDEPRHLAAAEAVARRVLAEVDRTCSRFRDDSDLSRANARPGRWVEVDPVLVAATRVALEAARVSAGLVDPCLGRRLTALGYDADLAVLRARGPRDLATSTHTARRPASTRPGGRSGSTTRRSGSPAAPPSTSARPRRPGPPTWWPRASSTSSGAGWSSASAATSGSTAPTTPDPRRCRRRGRSR